MKPITAYLELAAVIITVLTPVFVFLRWLNEIWPVTTVIFALAGTLFAFGNWKTASLSIAGLGLYAGCWPAVHAFGIWPAQMICMAGILTWFGAVFLSFRSLQAVAARIRY